jgi:hypothetical protein
LIDRRNAIKEEVTMGLDLMADDTPRVNFADYGYRIGVSVIGINTVEVCPEGAIDLAECYEQDESTKISMDEVSK